MTTAPGLDEAIARTLAAEGEAVREFLRSNRSDTHLRLFDYLLQQTLDGHRPKEAEIAEGVLYDSHDADSTHGSRIRVGIHRLRKKLETFYADRPGPRIVIPHGEYGLVLETPEVAARSDPPPPPPRATALRQRPSLWFVGIALLLANAALAWVWFGDGATGNRTSLRTSLWRGFDATQPTRVVLGDYFMYMSTSADGKLEIPMQDLSIFEVDGFYERLSLDPLFNRDPMTGDDATVSVMDGNAHTVSVDVLEAVSTLWPSIESYAPRAVSASSVDAAMMKSANIVYVGALDGLSPLIGDPLFRVSRFRCTDTCYELVDKQTERRFLSGSPYLLRDQVVPRHDYGYIASFPGPSGKRILVISGTGDAGVRQMVTLATDPKRLQQLGQRIGGDFTSFEALYQVRTMFAQSYQSTLLMAHPIDTSGVWDTTAPLDWQPAPRDED